VCSILIISSVIRMLRKTDSIVNLASAWIPNGQPAERTSQYHKTQSTRHPSKRQPTHCRLRRLTFPACAAARWSPRTSCPLSALRRESPT
jgi:hypothetical protein